jgi:hypothetical protein
MVAIIFKNSCVIYNKSNTTGATSGAGTKCRIGSMRISPPPVFSGVRFAKSLVLCVVFCKSLFVLFHMAIVLSVLWLLIIPLESSNFS